MPWSAVDQCLESPNLFVLVKRPKELLVLPKRAFPDEKWQSWFRHQANNRAGSNDALIGQAPTIMPLASADALVLTFQLGLRDYFDRTIASWRTWALIIGMIVFMNGLCLLGTIFRMMNPPPHPVHSSWALFVMFLPLQLGMVVVALLLFSVNAWYLNRKSLFPREVTLSDDGITIASQSKRGDIRWNTSRRFKETRWSFILWASPGPAWLMLPKRAFSSPADVQHCRALLSRHLQRSRWFFG